MYQAVYYDYPEKTYFIRDDREGWVDFKYQPTFYRRCSKNIEGALPVLTGGYAVPTKKYDYNDQNLLEKDIPKEILILRDLYYKQDDTIPSFHNIAYLDIEIEMGGALTADYIRASPMPITSMALIDITTKTKTCFIVDKAGELIEIIEPGKHVVPCKTERELMTKFLDLWEQLDITIVATWNGEWFDMPYIYYRFKQVVGEQETLRLSPIKKINIQLYKPEKGLVDESKITIGGINHLDYMLLHKKYIMKEEPSYKLGDIGYKYVNLEKIEYEGNLNNLFKNDKKLFIDYNFRDVEILEALEIKLKFVELTVLICHICNIPYEQVYYNTALGEGATLKLLKREGIVSPNKPTTTNRGLYGRKETYAGGYIKEPICGLYFDVIDLDFTSLYPSIIKSLNLGIETLIGRIKTTDNYVQTNSLEKLKDKDQNEIITIERLNKETYTLQAAEVTVGNLIEIIEDNNYTVSASGAFFRTDIKSATSRILETWFEKREYYRGLKKLAGKEKDWDKYKLYDNFQYAFKILQNAMYGTFAKNMWRYSDGHLICSSAITNTGQRLTQESITFTNTLINKELKSNKDYVCISDTDSMYIQVGDIAKYRYPNNFTKEEKNIAILQIASEIQDKANDYLNALSAKMLNIATGHYFTLKQEVIAQSIIVTGKRRYAMYITNKEGVAVEELDLKGIELMKSNMNKMFKTFGENMIKDILFGVPKQKIDATVINFYKSLAETDPKFLGKPMGVKQLANYVKRSARSGEIFSEFVLGAPSNTKAAVRYNDLLRFKRLEKKYEQIIEGDKIFVINLKENPYKIETIGISTGKVPEEITAFIKQFIDIELIFTSILLNKLKSLYEDIKWDFPNLNPKIERFFKFN